MMRFIERNLDVEWLLFIIAILLLMLVLDMLFKRRISTVMLNHHLSKIEKNTRNTINIISDIYIHIAELDSRDKIRHSHYVEDRRKEGKLP